MPTVGPKIGKKIAVIGSGQSSRVELYRSSKPQNRLFVVKVVQRDQASFAQYKSKCLAEFAVSELLHNSTSTPALQTAHSHNHSDGSRYLAQILAYKVSGVASLFGKRQISLVMPLYPVTLSEYLARSPSLRRKLAIFAQVALGVRHLHSRGVLHRDLKVDNICLDAAGTAKIIDFGTCMVSPGREDGKEEALTGIYGTDPFISPEAVSSLTYRGTRNDIWSLGVILYVLASVPETAGPSSVLANGGRQRKDMPARMMAELVQRGTTLRHGKIRYPWDTISASDAYYQAYKLHQQVVESQERELKKNKEAVSAIAASQGQEHQESEAPGYSEFLEYEAVLNDQVAPRHIKSVLDMTEVPGVTVTMKQKAQLEGTELGIYRLLRTIDHEVPQGVWRTLADCLKLDPGLRRRIDSVVGEEWVREAASGESRNGMEREKERKMDEKAFEKTVKGKMDRFLGMAEKRLP